MPELRSRARAMCVSLVLAAALVALLPSSGQTVSGGAVQVFTSQADTYASSSAHSKTYGSRTSMRVDGSPRVGYVRFSVSGVSGSVTRTSLRVYATRSYSPGFQVRSVANNAWDEQTLKWHNRPEVSSAVTASSGPVAARSWVSLDVSSVVQGNGTYSFALTGTGSGSTYLLLATKEAGSATAPQLVVEDSGVADTSPPSTPTDLRPLSATASSVTLGWTAATDAVAVTAYGIYQDGSFLGTTAETSYMLGGLACGRSYSLSVDARDAAGNRSPQASLTIATGSCDDTQPPSAPTGLVTRAATETSISLGWNPSTDDVGVAGYNLYVEGGSFGSTQATAHTFEGLSCGRTYTLGVEAYDAAGNLSPRATLAAGTSYCSTPATSYYVDDTAGNDANTGTSPGAAWRTLARASTAALVPGDTLLLKRGGSWTESLRVSRSGSAGAPIRIAAYGTGDSPRVGGVGSCIMLSGSYLVVRELHPDDCSWAGVEVRGSNNRVEANVITRNAAGVDIKAGALDNAILRNEIKDNNKMSVLTQSPTDDDTGAYGILLHGDGTEVAYNRISGSDAFSYDYGRDGSAIEVFGAKHSNVHHNVSLDNLAFTELGNARSADNSYTENVVRSSLATSEFLITRGSASSWGPILRTRAYNNSVLLTGSSSQGFVCHGGCSTDILTMRNNVIQAVYKVGYADAAFDESNNLFYGGMAQFTLGPGSIVANPQFVDPAAGDLHLKATSPAIDAGVDVGLSRDFDDVPIPQDGNGDGNAVPDLGAFERPAAPPRGGDTSPPSASGACQATGSTQTSSSTFWTSRDNVGVTGYRLYRGTSSVATTTGTTFTLRLPHAARPTRSASRRTPPPGRHRARPFPPRRRHARRPTSSSRPPAMSRAHLPARAGQRRATSKQRRI